MKKKTPQKYVLRTSYQTVSSGSWFPFPSGVSWFFLKRGFGGGGWVFSFFIFLFFFSRERLENLGMWNVYFHYLAMFLIIPILLLDSSFVEALDRLCVSATSCPDMQCAGFDWKISWYTKIFVKQLCCKVLFSSTFLPFVDGFMIFSTYVVVTFVWCLIFCVFVNNKIL